MNLHRASAIAACIIVLAASLTVSVPAVSQTTPDSKPFQPAALGMAVPVITSHNELDAHLGRLVAVRGTITRTKAPTILGVDVRNSSDLDSVDAYAVGVLTRHELTADDHAESQRLYGPFASRGPGVTYHLYFDLSGRHADAKPWPASKTADNHRMHRSGGG